MEPVFKNPKGSAERLCGSASEPLLTKAEPWQGHAHEILGEFARRQKVDGHPKRLCQQFLQFPQFEQSGTKKWVHEEAEDCTYLFRLVEHCRQ